MPDVFISYERTHAGIARRVADALAVAGYDVWWDAMVPPHRSYRDAISEQLRASRAAIVLWSREAVQSQWVVAEADVARERGALIQVALDDVVLPLPFDQIQCTKLVGWNGETTSAEWHQVIASVRELVRESVQHDAAVVRSPNAELLLAVLPFDNLSSDPDLLYFTDGVSEEILQTVAQTARLKTIGRSSSFQFRGVDKNVRNVARQLRATHVLDGSVRRSGARVRIAAQLIECATQTTLWAQRFDRELSDVFALQDEIAAAVAAALNVTFAASTQTGQIDPVAYDDYLRARSAAPGRLGSFDIEALTRATQCAPRFAAAWAALAYSLAVQARMPSAPLPASVRERARAAAHTALTLDPSSGIAYTALSYLEPVCGRFIETETLIENAMLASPNDAVVLARASRFLFGLGRIREAFDIAARAHEVDPFFAQAANEHALLLFQRGRRSEAFAVWDDARSRWPQYDVLTSNPLLYAAIAGDVKRVEALARSPLDANYVRWCRNAAPLLLERAPNAVDDFMRRGRTFLEQSGTVSLNFIWVATILDRVDETYELIGRASFARLLDPAGSLLPDDYGLHALFDVSDAALRCDPRFVDLCGTLGLVEYWRRTDRWPDCLDEIRPFYDFKAVVAERDTARLAAR